MLWLRLRRDLNTRRAVITNLFVRRRAQPRRSSRQKMRNRNLICAPTIHHCHPRSGANLNSCRDLAAVASMSRIVWARVIYRKVPDLGVIRNNRTVVRDCCFASPRDDVSSDVNGVPPPSEGVDRSHHGRELRFWKRAQQKRRIVERVNSFCALAHQLHYLSSREGIATLSYAEGHGFSLERVD